MTAWLVDDAAPEPLAAAARALAEYPGDPLRAGTALRRAQPAMAPAVAAACLEQAELRRRAREQYGIVADDLLLTRDGLEQATRPEVADHRAAVLRAAGVERVLDLTAGLGFDTAAFLRAGLTVTALERDPDTARLCRHNNPEARVSCADATDPATLEPLLARLPAADAVFVDPARRDPRAPRDGSSGRSRPERDPGRWSPPWTFVEGLSHPRVAAKVAPGFRVPAGWQAEWTSVRRTVVECAVYSWDALGADRRAAVVAPSGAIIVLGGRAEAAPTAEAIGPWLHEPDPAVVRAGLAGALAREVPGVAQVDPDSSWLTGAEVARSPRLDALMRSYRVLAELTGSAADQRRELARHDVGAITVKTADVSADPAAIRRRLDRPEGAGHVVIVLTRLGRAISLLALPATRQSG